MNLTADLDNESHCKNQYAMNLRKAERKLKDMEIQQEEMLIKVENIQVSKTLSTKGPHTVGKNHLYKA